MDDDSIVLSQPEFTLIQNYIELIMVKLLYSSIKDPYSTTINDDDYKIALHHIVRLGNLLQVTPKLNDDNVIFFDMKNLYEEINKEIKST